MEVRSESAVLLALKICRWDADASLKSAKMHSPRPRVLAGFGETRMAWLKVVAVADRAAVAAWFARAAMAGAKTPPPLDYRVVLKSKSVVWVRHWIDKRGSTGSRTKAGSSANGWTGFLQVIDLEKKLSTECLQIVEQAREAVGQELHDDGCQMLAGLACLVEAKAKRTAPAEVKKLLLEVGQQLWIGMTRMRALAHGLVPAPTLGTNLGQALRDLARQSETLYSVKIVLHLPSPLQRHQGKSVLQLQGIARESIANAIKHGHATVIHITLRASGKMHTLEITDNGLGLAPAHACRPGLGLQLMRRRATVLGGVLTVKNSHPRGVSVSLVYAAP